MITIVGGGPAGLFAAAYLAKAREVTVFEEHDTVGCPIQCTGLLSETVHELYKVPAAVIAAKLHRARILAPNGGAVDVAFRHPNLLVFRDAFDRSIAELAEDRGARVFCGHKFEGVRGGTVTVLDKAAQQRRAFQTERLIGADGPTSEVAKYAGIFSHRADLLGLQVTKRAPDLDAIEFYPYIGEYAWAVPQGDGLARIGLGLRHRDRAVFDAFLKKYPGDILDRQAGLIPLHHPRIPTHTTLGGLPVSLVGDAAGQIKNTTGGGILPGMRAAKILAETALHGGDYVRAWKGTLGRELWAHYKANEVFRRFSGRDWDHLIGYFQQDRLRRILGAQSRDNLSKMLLRIAFNEPRLLRFVPKMRG